MNTLNFEQAKILFCKELSRQFLFLFFSKKTNSWPNKIHWSKFKAFATKKKKKKKSYDCQMMGFVIEKVENILEKKAKN